MSGILSTLIYSGEMIEVVVIQPCTYTHPNQEREVFPVGTYRVPVEVAKSEYFQHHTNTPPPPLPSPGTAAFNTLTNQRMREAMLRNNEAARRDGELRTAAAAATPEAVAATIRAQMEPGLRTQIEIELRAELESKVRIEITEQIMLEARVALHTEIENEVRLELAAASADLPKRGRAR